MRVNVINRNFPSLLKLIQRATFSFDRLQKTLLILLTFASHSNVRLHLDLTIVGSNYVPDLVGPLLIRMDHVILPEVLAHELRMSVQTAPIMRIVCKNISYVFVEFSGAFFKLSHLHVCGPLLCFYLSDGAWFRDFIILFRLFILISNGGLIAYVFDSARLALGFNFGISFGFHEFSHILQVWKLIVSR